MDGAAGCGCGCAGELGEDIIVQVLEEAAPVEHAVVVAVVAVVVVLVVAGSLIAVVVSVLF